MRTSLVSVHADGPPSLCCSRRFEIDVPCPPTFVKDRAQPKKTAHIRRAGPYNLVAPHPCHRISTDPRTIARSAFEHLIRTLVSNGQRSVDLTRAQHNPPVDVADTDNSQPIHVFIGVRVTRRSPLLAVRARLLADPRARTLALLLGTVAAPTADPVGASSSC